MISDHDQHLELSLYTHSTQTEEKILSSCYMPAGVQLLANESGFSFIDDGIFCIKLFDRRSVHMVESSEPLYDIEYIHWLDNEFCYFHAKKAGHNGIHMMDADGTVVTLLEGNDDTDYTYPFIISDILFCITCNRKTNKIQYSVDAAPYQDIKNHDNVLQTILTIGMKPLALLHMVTATEGFFLEYPSTRDSEDQLFPITCYHFFFVNSEWRCSPLFTFLIPCPFLFDPHARLYESLLPLVPCYALPFVYYCSFNPDNNKLCLYSYLMETGKSQLIKQENASLLAPRIMNKMLIYGGEITNEDCGGLKMLQIADRNCYDVFNCS